MASLYNPYPPNLTQEQTENLLFTLKDWTIAHGLAVRPSPELVSKDQDPQGVLAIPAPLTLFPSLFPKSCFKEAVGVQQAYNELYAKIAQDETWLGEIIQE
jgi:glutathione synthase